MRSGFLARPSPRASEFGLKVCTPGSTRPLASSRYGWETLTANAQYLAVLDGPHEFLFSVGVDRQFGGTGAGRVQRRGFSGVGATTPTIYFGKGLGDLDIGYLRPLAISGTFGYLIADKSPRPGRSDRGFRNRIFDTLSPIQGPSPQSSRTDPRSDADHRAILNHPGRASPWHRQHRAHRSRCHLRGRGTQRRGLGQEIAQGTWRRALHRRRGPCRSSGAVEPQEGNAPVVRWRRVTAVAVQPRRFRDDYGSRSFLIAGRRSPCRASD
jgi:hypothetical protein